MDLKFAFYVLTSCILLLGGTYRYIKSGQDGAGAIFFLGMLAAVLVFGFRWFTPAGETKGKNTAWPPTINYCPDYLSLMKDNNVQVCVDTIGIANGGIVKYSGSGTPADNQKFNLSLDKSGEPRVQALCKECADKKVTWEGVWDGSSCLGNEPPVPPAARAV